MRCCKSPKDATHHDHEPVGKSVAKQAKTNINGFLLLIHIKLYLEMTPIAFYGMIKGPRNSMENFFYGASPAEIPITTAEAVETRPEAAASLYDLILEVRYQARARPRVHIIEVSQ